MKKFSDYCDLAASMEDVAGAIMSEDYLRYRYDSEFTTSFELDIKQDNEQGFAYSLRRELDVGSKVPRVVRNLVGDSFVVLQEASWQRNGDEYLGKAKLSAERFKGGIDIDIIIQPQGKEQCRLSFEGRLKAEVPLIGGQLERMMVDRVSDNFAESIEAIEGYLKGEHQA
ncbi:MAG: DUF2505 domain-containing protein [Salinisphaeraceae bacterium]|nr:DUF2505 domain-containing protein [Salinisphaeraceae bacterium]